jgi:hypothetical protein
MFEEQDYLCRCHVCGVKWILRARFVSCAQWADGSLMLTCNGNPANAGNPPHTPAEVKASWLGHGGPSAPYAYGN